MFEYQARVINVYDGDTIHAEVYLGIDVRIRLTLRLYGINAPELRTPGGPPARDHLVALIGDFAVPLTVRTIKDHKEKYGRYLATLIRDGVDLNQAMVADGFAVVYLP